MRSATHIRDEIDQIVVGPSPVSTPILVLMKWPTSNTYEGLLKNIRVGSGRLLKLSSLALGTPVSGRSPKRSLELGAFITL